MGSRHGIDELPRCRCHARHPTEQIEDDTLRRQHTSRRATERRHHGPSRDDCAIRDERPPFQLLIGHTGHDGRGLEACDHSGPPGDHIEFRAGTGWHEGHARPVTFVPQILGKP